MGGRVYLVHVFDDFHFASYGMLNISADEALHSASVKFRFCWLINLLSISSREEEAGSAGCEQVNDGV